MEAKNQSVMKAFEIIEQLSEFPQGLSLTEFSEKMDSNKTTLLRFLTSLREMGYVEQAPDKTYRLTLKLYALSSRVVSDQSLIQVARPYLVALSQNIGEVVHLVVDDGLYVLYVDKVESDHPVTMRSKVGARAPMVMTGVGKALLAEKSDRDIQRIWEDSPQNRATSKTLTSLDALMERIDATRQSGIAYDLEENEEDIMCTAAAIHGVGHQVMGALSVTGPTYRMKDKMGEALDALVRHTAQAISRDLGDTATPSHPAD